MTMPDAWTERAFVEIQELGETTNVQFHAVTDDITINEGDRPGESIANLAGGRIWTDKPAESGEITLTMYPVELDTSDITGVGGLFQQYSGQTWDTDGTVTGFATAGTSGELDTTRRYSKDKFRVCIAWTNDTTASPGATSILTRASGTNVAGSDALRFVAKACRIVSHSVTFNPGEPLKVEVTLKFSPFTKEGYNNYLWQSANSADTSPQLPDLGDYSS